MYSITFGVMRNILGWMWESSAKQLLFLEDSFPFLSRKVCFSLSHRFPRLCDFLGQRGQPSLLDKHDFHQQKRVIPVDCSEFRKSSWRRLSQDQPWKTVFTIFYFLRTEGKRVGIPVWGLMWTKEWKYKWTVPTHCVRHYTEFS